MELTREYEGMPPMVEGGVSAATSPSSTIKAVSSGGRSGEGGERGPSSPSSLPPSPSSLPSSCLPSVAASDDEGGSGTTRPAW